MTDAPPATLLSARHLTCAIDDRTLWRELAFDVRAGERWSISGPSGSGKTVLLRTLAGLAAQANGELRLDDKPIERWWMPAWRARVCYVAQRPALPEGTVGDALAAPFALRIHRRRRFRADVVSEYLDRLGLDPGFGERSTDNLSGGESQLAALIRALLIEPAVLLLDEPTASIDAGRVGRIEALIADWLAGQPGERAYIWTSHDTAQIERVADRVLPLGEPR